MPVAKTEVGSVLEEIVAHTWLQSEVFELKVAILSYFLAERFTASRDRPGLTIGTRRGTEITARLERQVFRLYHSTWTA